MSTYNGSFPSAAACGCTAVWGWSPARKSFWSAGGITYDANQTSGTCAHRNVFQRPDTNFRMQGRREEGWLPGKEPAGNFRMQGHPESPWVPGEEPAACDHVAVWVSDHHWTIKVKGITPLGTLPSRFPVGRCGACLAEVPRPPHPGDTPPAPEMVIEYTMTDETPRPEKHVLPRAPSSDRGWTRAEFASKVLPYDEVLVAARGTKWVMLEGGINPGQIAQGVWVTTHRGERRVLILAGIHPGVPYAGYVTVKVLHRSGDVHTSMHCTECGAGEGELHRRGDECPGLRKMRHRAGLSLERPCESAIAHVKETRLRPYKSEQAVMMVDDMSEPP